MFKVLGADGKEYGPVAAEQLRQWIREGRAGGTTQVQAEGEAGWTPLQKRAEFADVFSAPVLSVGDGTFPLPPVAQTIAWAQFVVAGISALWLLLNFLTLIGIVGNGIGYAGLLYYFGWGVGVLSLPIRVVSGIGLLRGREWARRLAVGFAMIISVYGLWGLVRTVMWFTATPEPSFALRSPMFLLSHLWSLALFTFNIATAVFLSRKDVCAAFSRKSSASV